MKTRLLLLSAAIAAITIAVQAARLGSLKSDDTVYTPSDGVMLEGLYPVFQIWVPEGVTEVQIRASVNNFQESVLLFETGGEPGFEFSQTFRCTGIQNGRNYYMSSDQPWDDIHWTGARWEFGNDFVNCDDDVEFPWQCTSFNPAWFVFQLDNDDKFVYRWCSTGQDADNTWGAGVQDGDAELFFANQKGVNPYSQYQMQRWLGDTADATAAGYAGTALTAQMQAAGTPGRYVIFQPSRAAHLLNGANGDWMRQANTRLQWVVQYETVAGWETHPDGSPVWSAIRPIEWRTARLELQQEFTPTEP